MRQKQIVIKSKLKFMSIFYFVVVVSNEFLLNFAFWTKGQGETLGVLFDLMSENQ